MLETRKVNPVARKLQKSVTKTGWERPGFRMFVSWFTKPAQRRPLLRASLQSLYLV